MNQETKRHRWGQSSDTRAGYSLIETLVTLVIMSVLAAMGVPRFQQSLEQAKANVAAGNLRSVWAAERLYWLENRSYAPDLATLQAANLIDSSLATVTAPYSYQVTVSTDGSSFTATATRSGSAYWNGSFIIAIDGSFSGSVQSSGGATTIVPNFQ